MNLTATSEVFGDKRIFTPKPKQRDGLLLNLHCKGPKQQTVRFTHTAFNRTGQIVASADNDGNIFIIDLAASKYWNLPSICDSCSCLKFSCLSQNELLVAERNGTVNVVDVQAECVSGQLLGHQWAVTSISFARDVLCLTASIKEASVWNLVDRSRIRELRLQKDCILKFVRFMPVTDNILACFHDDFIQIWRYDNSQSIMQLHPVLWHKRTIKNIALSSNGERMVIACHPSSLAVFSLNTWKLTKFVALPECVQTIKHVDFCTRDSDKTLALLSGQGTVYFYNLDQSAIISELVPNYTMIRYDWAVKDSKNYMVCVLCSGDVIIYDVTDYIAPPVRVKSAQTMPNKNRRVKKCLSEAASVKRQLSEILEKEKLQMILKEFGQYPDLYRTRIWEHLLQLPNNTAEYEAVINHCLISSFEDLDKDYPLENKSSLRNLRKLLDNLVMWCQFLAHVKYLPVFVFPFVKVFQNKPVAAFEAVCTIIVNWCQYWFEYFPLPPLNVLAIIENLLLEHDPELMRHLSEHEISAKLYAWPLLQTAFSEVLTAPEWRVFWDHVLTNEPSFLPCAVVAFNMIERSGLLLVKGHEMVRKYYHDFHPIDVRKLIKRTYQIYESDSVQCHPRQYLAPFRAILPGEYPVLCGYPKDFVECEESNVRGVNKELREMELQKEDMAKQHVLNVERLKEYDIKDEENKRVFEMEKAFKRKLLDQRKQVENYYSKLREVRENFVQEEADIDNITQKRLSKNRVLHRSRLLSSLMDDERLDEKSRNHIIRRAEDDLLMHYSELLRHKICIENMLDDSYEAKSSRLVPRMVDTHQKLLREEIENVNMFIVYKLCLVLNSSDSVRDLSIVNVHTGVSAIDSLMQKIEQELANETFKNGLNPAAADRRVLKLQGETDDLISRISSLMESLGKV